MFAALLAIETQLSRHCVPQDMSSMPCDTREQVGDITRSFSQCVSKAKPIKVNILSVGHGSIFRRQQLKVMSEACHRLYSLVFCEDYALDSSTFKKRIEWIMCTRARKGLEACATATGSGK